MTRLGHAAAIGLAAVTLSLPPGRAALLEPDAVPAYGTNRYVEYRAGTLPLIISAPHGGDLAPASVPDRRAGLMNADIGTIDLTLRVASELTRLTGRRPHLVICRLARAKVDVNRELQEGASANTDAARVWEEYHRFIETATATAVSARGRAIYVDLHGHSHPVPRVELGYLLEPEDLALSDSALDQDPISSRSSVQALLGAGLPAFSTLVRGPASLGAELSARGYESVPSPAVPDPGGTPYYAGGYSIRRHGTRPQLPVGAIQIELPFAGVRDTAAHRATFATALASSLRSFAATHARLDF
jgi:N-formylglutamate amidohydrolase